jgi:aminoglycoside phosphotransferase (APT) family kinase protein
MWFAAINAARSGARETGGEAMNAGQDIERRLEAFLGGRLNDATTITVSDYQNLIGGYSRIMSTFTATIDGREQRFVSRADGPPGQALFDTDRDAEWELLSALTADGRAPMPRALFYDADGSELGAKTIILEYADGAPFMAQVRGTGDDLTARTAHADKLCDLVADIHRVDPATLPTSLERPTSWDSYVDSLIGVWRRVEHEHVESDPFFRYMATWLDDNRPEPAPLTLVHGEFQGSNAVTDANGTLLAVDWEFAHIGDPREDLGWCKWVGAMQPPDLIGHDEERFLARYRERSGLSERVINPLTLAYFSILPAIRVWEGFSKQQRAFVERTNRNIGTGYSLAVLVSAHEGWCQAAKQIDSTKSNLEAMSR